MATGGSIEKVSLAGRQFTIAADGDASYNLGGFSNEVQPNGDGTARTKKTRVPWKVSGLPVVIDSSTDDLAFLQSLADGNEFAAQVTLADETVLNAVGVIQGDLAASTMNSTVPVELSGGGKIT